jgi:3-phosphoshikimate 1-carboxyvinyltransferase
MNKTLSYIKFAREVAAPASKSAAHRPMILAAFADAPTEISIAGAGEDIQATARCLRALGATVEGFNDGKSLRITPANSLPERAVCDCGESGTTLRFLVPVAAALGIETTFLRKGRLPERPMEPLCAEMARHGANFRENPDRSLTVMGRLEPGEYRIRADVSSQFVSGLLLALSLLRYPSTLMLEGEIESVPYINMTLETLSGFKAAPICVANGRLFGVPGCLAQPLHTPKKIGADGDFSSAAFPLAAGAIGADPVTVTGLNPASAQGDAAILALLDEFGAKIDVDQKTNAVTVFPSQLHGIRINAAQIPDLVPVLAVVAAAAKGDTEITNAKRLRLKESDRLTTTAAMLRALGGEVEEREDGLLIHGKGGLQGGFVDGANDHRIVMSAAVAALICKESVTVSDAEAVKKSYPAFFDIVREA